MKILIICKEFPHSKVIGGPIIIYNRLKYLSKRHLVSLAAFYKRGEEKFISSIKPFCYDLRLVPFPKRRSSMKTLRDLLVSPVPPYFLKVHSSVKMTETVAQMVQKDHYDFVIAEYSVMGQFIHNNPLLPPIRRIISVHECYYISRLKDFHNYRFGIRKVKEAMNLKGLKKYEFDMYRNADKILTLTPQGREELLRICPDLNISVVPHGVDVNDFSFSPSSGKEKSIVFVGNYLHYPNVDAVLFFQREIWPYLTSLVPKIKFYIVGQAPPEEIKCIADDKSIIVTGKVDDVRPYLEKGKVFICPVRLGGGFRGKILESMAIGRPVVSTSLGAEGIPAKNRENILIADNPKDFAHSIFELLNDDYLFQKIRINARKLVEEKYSWEKGVEVLEGVLEKMMKTLSHKNKYIRM